MILIKYKEDNEHEIFKIQHELLEGPRLPCYHDATPSYCNRGCSSREGTGANHQVLLILQCDLSLGHRPDGA
jgi:hypothetical protein